MGCVSIASRSSAVSGAGLQQDAVGDRDLADVVQHAGELHRLGVQAELLAQHRAVVPDALEVAADAGIAVLGRLGPAVDRLALQHAPLCGSALELLQRVGERARAQPEVVLEVQARRSLARLDVSPAQRRHHADQDGGATDGLAEVAVGAEVHRDLRDPRVLQGADQQRRGRRVLAQREADEVQARLARHAHVAEQQRDLLVLQRVAGLTCAADPAHLVARLAEHADQHVAHGLVVVDDEDHAAVVRRPVRSGQAGFKGAAAQLPQCGLVEPADVGCHGRRSRRRDGGERGQARTAVQPGQLAVELAPQCRDALRQVGRLDGIHGRAPRREDRLELARQLRPALQPEGAERARELVGIALGARAQRVIEGSGRDRLHRARDGRDALVEVVLVRPEDPVQAGGYVAHGVCLSRSRIAAI